MDISDIGDFFGEYGVPIGMASQGLGTILRTRANKKVGQEQARRMQEHRARMARLQQQREAQMAAALPRFTRESEEAARGDLAAKYEQFMQPTVATGDAGEYINATDDASTEVKTRAARELAKALDKGRLHAKNAAAIDAFGGVDQQNRIALGDTTRGMQRLATAGQNYTSILPMQLDEAHRAGRNLNLGADLANGLGQASFLWGITQPRRPTPQAPATGTGLRPTGATGMTGLIPGRGRQGLRLG